MRQPILNIYTRGLQRGVLVAGLAYAGTAAWLERTALVQEAAPLAALAVGGTLAALLALAPGTRRPPRFALTFVLAALVVLPAPGALLVGLAAALAGGGGRVAGAHRGGPLGWAILIVSLALAQFGAGLALDIPHAAALGSLGALILGFLVLQGLSPTLDLVLGGEFPSPRLLGRRSGWRPRLLELLNVPLAWLLAEQLSQQAWAQAAALAGLALSTGWILLALDRTLACLSEANNALTSRVDQLATLHAIGREIPSSLDPQRVFGIIERECRKIFEVDDCLIALLDSESAAFRIAYHRRRGAAPDGQGAPLEHGLALYAARHNQPLRMADFSRLPDDSPLSYGIDYARLRSALAVPLVVEQRVIGVLAVHSRLPEAYDDQQLEVLATIAQQAAVAIENARNYQLATVDSLTGFYSRDWFFRRLEDEHRRVARYGGTFALLMLDLDGFKQINDSCGHLAGDEVLRSISATVRTQLRDADLPCRYGGDEFCLLLPETDLGGAESIAERIREAVSQCIVGYGGLPLHTTISIGVAAFPEHDAGDLSGLLHNADEALYRAKRRGRNCVVPFAA